MAEFEEFYEIPVFTTIDYRSDGVYDGEIKWLEDEFPLLKKACPIIHEINRNGELVVEFKFVLSSLERGKDILKRIYSELQGFYVSASLDERLSAD